MRTNNSHVKKIIVSIYFVFLVLAISLPIFVKSLRIFSGNATLSSIVLVIAFAFLFLIVHFICRFFEYDSDGDKIIITNKGLLLSNYINYRQHVAEFDKEDLIAYSFKNYIIFRTLSVYIKDSRGGKRKETFNITLVTKRKRRYIAKAVAKIVKANNMGVTSNAEAAKKPIIDKPTATKITESAKESFINVPDYYFNIRLQFYVN